MTVFWYLVGCFVSFFFGALWGMQRIRSTAFTAAKQEAERRVMVRMGELVDLTNQMSDAERILGPEDPEEHERRVKEIIERAFDDG
jgi:hypothetical protein